MPTIIQLAKSKTIWFSNALVVLGLIQQFSGLLPIPAEYMGAVMAAVGVASTLLRFVTTTALNEK